MKVILQQDVKKLGSKGTVVEVSDGYARNYLLPRGLAMEATKGNLQQLKRQKARKEAQERQELEKAKKLAEQLEQEVIVIRTKAGEKGRLFGSVTSKEIADTISQQLDVKVDKRKIILDEPIKNIGVHPIQIKLHPDVQAQVKVRVVTDQ